MSTDIFVSRPTWVDQSYEKGLQIFLATLGNLDLNPRTLGSTDYPTKSPLDEVINILKNCRGAVILGYPQISVSSGTIKNETLGAPIELPTEWNHIEAGLAYSMGLPLLVIHQNNICRGIFDRGALNSFLFSKDLSDPAWSAEEDITGALRSWRDEALQYKPTPPEQRSTTAQAIIERQNEVWTVMAIGRKILDPRPVGSNHRESAECKIEEVTDFYIKISILSSGRKVTIPMGDITISYDDKRHRHMLELRTSS